MRAESRSFIVVAAVLAACSTTRTMERPLSDTDRIHLALRETSGHWQLRSSSTPADAATPRLVGGAIEFKASDGSNRKVPLEALESIVVDHDQVRGGFEGAGFRSALRRRARGLGRVRAR
jgi:hypothetical protein